MKNIIAAVLLLAAPAAFAAGEKAAGEKVIYGADDRLDYFQAPSEMRRLADSVVSLWKGSDVTAAAGGSFRLATANYGEVMGLCQGEPYRAQPIGAFCSGSLVGKDLVMTAGHCIKNEEDCANTKFVFGFRLDAAGGQPGSATAADVYSCKKIVTRYLKDNEVGAAAEGRTPLEVNRGKGPAKGDGIFVIGHPSGLPVKVAGGAAVRDSSPKGYFVANLDTYGGNSGSAVFNAKTGLIEGILVRGENDFVNQGDCRVSNVVPSDGGRGEDVTKVSEVTASIPKGSPAVVDVAMPQTKAAPATSRVSFDGN